MTCFWWEQIAFITIIIPDMCDVTLPVEVRIASDLDLGQSS